MPMGPGKYLDKREKIIVLAGFDIDLHSATAVPVRVVLF